MGEVRHFPAKPNAALTVPRLARHIAKSERTILRYMDQGLPFEDGPDNRRIIRLGVYEAWIKERAVA